MTALFKPPKLPPLPPPPAPPPPIPTREDESIAQAKREERRRIARQQGRRASILTSPTGLSDDDADIETRSLLGKSKDT
jgi:hypothetical protein|tara:strand:+ start:1116 stop:1352 length:237 start_codon:yes stop_codon:yes gene_type:complete